MFDLAMIIGLGLCVFALFRLSEASDVIEDGRRMIEQRRANPYDWDREGDFEPPTWTRENHSPLAFIGPETVTVRCVCGYSHTEPITTTQASAYRSCTDEFWSTHMQEVAA